jgi:small GTP-binding protein
MNEKPDLKVVLLGPCNVGKTSVFTRYTQKTFTDDTRTTVGAGFCQIPVSSGDREAELMLWDTAGEERFRAIAPSILRGSAGMVLVYDLHRPESFHAMKEYMKMFIDTCAQGQSGQLPVLLLGNKLDLGETTISQEMVREWMGVNQIELHFHVSAKSGQNIHEAFEAFVSVLLDTKKADMPVRLEFEERPRNERAGICC